MKSILLRPLQQCKPRRLPHGWFSFVVTIATIVGWFLSLFQDGCNYAKVNGPIMSQLGTMTSTSTPYLEFGFDAYREPQIVLDTDMKLASSIPRISYDHINHPTTNVLRDAILSESSSNTSF